MHIYIVPWSRDFLECLASFILEKTNVQPGNAVVVFTHDRPKRYLIEKLQDSEVLPKPALLPCMMTIQDLWRQFTPEDSVSAYREIGVLDQISLLFSCVQKLTSVKDSPLNPLLGFNEAEFFPWGVHLASLFEECLIHGIKPKNLLYTEEDVEFFGAALLGALGQIFSLYKDTLSIQKIMTPALRSFIIAEQIRQKKYTELPDCLQNKHIFLAGFNTLSGSEDVLFRFLWEHGAHVCLHADEALTEQGNKYHWSCGAQAKWISSWNACATLVCPPKNIDTSWNFFAGYDMHSQLNCLRDDLSRIEGKANNSTAIVLTHSDPLIPILHHLPDKECNISLGYPLNKTLLFRMLESIFAIRDSRQSDGSTYYKSLIAFIRHPYLRFLKMDETPLYDVLQDMDHYICNGKRYIDLNSFLHSEGDKYDERKVLLEEIIHTGINVWASVDTPLKAAEALDDLCAMLLTYGQGVWSRFPLDSECLFRLLHRVIPALRDNSMSQSVLSWNLIRSMMLTLIQEERVPFEADPLIGVQVLGMLETRMVHFDRVFLVEATDDYLPGAPMRSPLLPDSLRYELGLPDTKHRDLLMAYTLYRLFAGAQEIYLYWQEGIESSGLFDSKKQRSRFVEDIIWKKEQELGRRLISGDQFLRTANPDIHPPHKSCRSIVKTSAIQQKIESFLSKPISATSLDGYLRCPLRFYFEKICLLKPTNEVREDDDFVAVGQLFHKVLATFYEEYVGKIFVKEDALEQKLHRIFDNELKQSELVKSLSPESAMMLSISGPKKLSQYLKCQPDTVEVVCVEKQFQGPIIVEGKTRILEGVIDRVDRRDGSSVILDYKTGNTDIYNKKIWDDDFFWEELDKDLSIENIKDLAISGDALSLYSKKIGSIQLVHYMYIYEKATGEYLHNAALVDLKDTGNECWLLEGLASVEKGSSIFFYMEKLLKIVLSHIEYSPEFRAYEGKHCTFCSWRNLCIISKR